MMKMRKLVLPIRAFSTKRYKKFSNKNVKNVQNYQVLKPNNANPNPGISNRLKMYEEDELAAEISASHDFEDLHEDMDEFEADFMNAGQSHWMHEKELKARKEKLKTKITYSKYLKEVEPSFLTFAEKEEIKSLHERNPHEWSVEKLSESFPALPATIKKVLHAKWSPKSVETVMKYDEKVINNWEAFRAGELSVSPMMKKHLENFKDRRIVPTNEELAKQYIPPKIEFPKPNSTMFSRIAKTFLIQDKENKISTDDTNTDKEVNFNIENQIKKRVFETNQDFYVSKNVKGRNKYRDIQGNEDYDEEIFESKINFQEQKTKNRVFESNQDFHVSKNIKGKNKHRDIQENEDYDEEIIESEINFQEQKAKNRVFESNQDFHVSKNIKGKNKHSDIEESEDYDEEIIESEINFQEQKAKNRVFESNQDFHVSKNIKGKNKHSDIEENEDYDEEIIESEINFQEQKALFVSNRNWEITDMNYETIENSDFKNRSLEPNRNSSYKERNFEENENTKKVRSLTIQEGYDNTKVVSTRKKKQMTVLSKNLEANGPHESKKLLTFDEFLIKNVGRTKDSSTPEDIVLKETYKRHMERIASDSKPAHLRESETEEEDFNSESKFESKESAIERDISAVSLKEEGKGAESRISTRRTRENEISNINKSQTDLISKQKESELSFSIQRTAVDTYVKEWIKKGDDIDDDPPFIHIPKNRYKEGMTYRVKNCYYDDDGEFLYKVPGLHN